MMGTKQQGLHFLIKSMRKPIFLLILFLFIPFSLSALTEFEINEKISKGKIIKTLYEEPGQRLKKGVAVGVIKAPVVRVWKVITDYEHFPEFWPHMKKKSKKLRDEGNLTFFEGHLDLVWPVKDVSYQIKLVHDIKKHKVSWKMIPGTGVNLVQNYGSWKLEPFGKDKKHTKVIYTLFAETVQKIPKFIMDITTKMTLSDVIKAVRKRVKNKMYDEKNPKHKIQMTK